MWITETEGTAGGAEVGCAPVSHLRLPSVSHGFAAFAWGFGLGAFIWLGLLAVGISGATAFIVGAVSGLLIFLLVRVYGAGGRRDQAERRGERAR